MHVYLKYFSLKFFGQFVFQRRRQVNNTPISTSHFSFHLNLFEYRLLNICKNPNIFLEYFS